MKTDRKNGSNFHEEPLSFEEFLFLDKNDIPIYNNFFLGFFGGRRNYKRLKEIDCNLAEELSNYRYFKSWERKKMPEDFFEGHPYPKTVIEKGYKAYLLLRERFKDSSELREEINEYYDGGVKGSDDFAAFFK